MAHEPAYALDPQLRAAQQEAQREYHQRQQQQQTTTTTTRNEHEEAEAERRPPVPPLVLKQLLSDEHIADLLRHVTAAGVWPRGLAAPPPGRGRAAAAAAAPAPAPPCAAGAALAAVPHHFAWTAEHVVLYLHNQDYWFVRTLQDAWCVVRGALEIRPWMPVGCRPELDAAFVGSDHALQRVRSIELHHYATGGNLVTPGHRDCGSELTLSVLLSGPGTEHTGGDFVTYHQGVPVVHSLQKGDAILFASEDLHNISTVTSGVRQSLVVELYPDKLFH